MEQIETNQNAYSKRRFDSVPRLPLNRGFAGDGGQKGDKEALLEHRKNLIAALICAVIGVAIWIWDLKQMGVLHG